jgi:hypothetical protein
LTLRLKTAGYARRVAKMREFIETIVAIIIFITMVFMAPIILF